MSHQFPPSGPPQPGYGYPPPPAPKKSNAGKIVGFSCLGVVGVVVLLGVVGALVTGGDDQKSPSRPVEAVASQPVKAPEVQPSKAPEKKQSVTVTAQKTAFKASVLAQGDGYTSVSVTVTNNSTKPINVNPLYFTLTDTNGTKHASQLAVDENQIDTVELAPGENITGAVTGKGAFSAKTVTYTDGLIGEAVRAEVP
ncbi:MULTISPECIES: DUF4352 domain-containing protein [unclassified Streptomyces]|uniref:DUF4352 domain-containing protein n=1 Tax=unclassified Streptomyces TaxID=2593676 RepID=UPI002E322462|nr:MULTISPECIES: DUF4352 domain-containing protein [unclassified Streptomyces]WUC66608.1 DUF4352 domain-containing protein [Streptomyces sp. NBC_00539]